MKAMLLALVVCLAVTAAPATVEAHAVTCAPTDAECIARCLQHVAENATKPEFHGCAIR